MDKLELKHIVGYLPYGLKMISQNDFVSPVIRKLSVDGFQFMIDTRKPILRPLSDLTKEIEVNGEKFVPIHYFNKSHLAGYFDLFGNCFVGFDYGQQELKIEEYPYWIIKKLYEWHFDIHGLIEKGSAINKNTLN